MFCPKCLTEYVEGVRTCPDCGIALIPELNRRCTPETLQWAEFEQIFATFNAGDIALVKSILDGEGIAYYFLGEHFNYMEPLAQAPRLMVRKDQAEQARQILGDLNLEYSLTRDVNESAED